MPSEMLRTSISLVTASLVATSLVATSVVATAIGAHAAAAENARHTRHAYAAHVSAGHGYAARAYAGRTYTGHARGPWLARGATLPYGPEYGFLRKLPPNAIVGPGYTFVPGVGILGASCDLPTSACTNEYRDVR
jgi:hypothetical protein